MDPWVFWDHVLFNSPARAGHLPSTSVVDVTPGPGPQHMPILLFEGRTSHPRALKNLFSKYPAPLLSTLILHDFSSSVSCTHDDSQDALLRFPRHPLHRRLWDQWSRRPLRRTLRHPAALGPDSMPAPHLQQANWLLGQRALRLLLLSVPLAPPRKPWTKTNVHRSNDECDPSNAVTLTNDTVAPDRFDDGDEFNLHSCWVVPSNLGV